MLRIIAQVLVFAAGCSGVTFGQALNPFGNPLGTSGNSASTCGYAGEWTDGTGLHYLRAPYYSLEQRRFITQDPFPGFMTQPAMLKAYAYALNDPVTLTDPSGENPLLAAVVLGGVIGGALRQAYRPGVSI